MSQVDRGGDPGPEEGKPGGDERNGADNKGSTGRPAARTETQAVPRCEAMHQRDAPVLKAKRGLIRVVGEWCRRPDEQPMETTMDLKFEKVNDFAGGTYKATSDNFTAYWYPHVKKLHIQSGGHGATIQVDSLPEITIAKQD